MEEKISNQSISRLDISEHIIEILINSNIDTIGKLCKKSKTDLKKIGLLQNEANKIEIELELLGLNLKNSL